MLLKIVLLAYSRGTTSSRVIESLCRRDVHLMAVAGTIAIYAFRGGEPAAGPHRSADVPRPPPSAAPEPGDEPTIELPEVELRGEPGAAPADPVEGEEGAPEEPSKLRRPRRREDEKQPPENERQGLPRWNWDG